MAVWTSCHMEAIVRKFWRGLMQNVQPCAPASDAPTPPWEITERGAETGGVASVPDKLTAAWASVTRVCRFACTAVETDGTEFIATPNPFPISLPAFDIWRIEGC